MLPFTVSIFQLEVEAWSFQYLHVIISMQKWVFMNRMLDFDHVLNIFFHVAWFCYHYNAYLLIFLDGTWIFFPIKKEYLMFTELSL